MRVGKKKIGNEWKNKGHKIRNEMIPNMGIFRAEIVRSF